MMQVHSGTRMEQWRERPRNGTPYALYSGTATERPSYSGPQATHEQFGRRKGSCR